MQANNLFLEHFWAIENHIENEQLIWIENLNWVVHVEFKFWIEFHGENENPISIPCLKMKMKIDLVSKLKLFFIKFIHYVHWNSWCSLNWFWYLLELMLLFNTIDFTIHWN